MSQASYDVFAERERQKTVEGWTEEHDDSYTNCQLSRAAACYAAEYPNITCWPSSWSSDWFKPKDRRSNLVRAAALLIAEIERYDRMEKKL